MFAAVSCASSCRVEVSAERSPHLQLDLQVWKLSCAILSEDNVVVLLKQTKHDL